MCRNFGLRLVFGLALVYLAASTDDFDEGMVSDEIQDIQDDSVNISPLNSDLRSEEEIDSYESPSADSESFYIAQNFDDSNEFQTNWILSKAKKDDTSDEIAKYDGLWAVELPKKLIWKNDYGLVLKSKAKHAAISSRLSKPFVFNEKPLVVQYEVTMQDGQECGGSYLKLLSLGRDTADLTKFNDKTPYSIMFGPDKCGNDVKLHFIFRHVNPINGTITEKHCRKPKERLEEPFKDKLPHLYQLLLKPDNTFQISVDHRVLNEGSLLNDFSPSVNPSKEIDDPQDMKPQDWDEREKIADPDSAKPDDWDDDALPQIPDPTATKPEGWFDDEPEMIADPNAVKPEDWDTEIDGDWEPPLVDNPICEKVVGCGLWKAPLITNPEYKGKWRAPLIDNPNYQGKWVPRKILNPDYFEDLNPFKMTAISAVGIELWSMSSDILFDNIIITDDIDVADAWAAKTFALKRKQLDKESKTIWERLMRYMGNKPGWWAIYFAYVSIPFGFYVRYLLKRAKEETFFNKLIKYSNDNPWLWGVYIVVIGTPLSFAFYTLCCSTNKDKEAAEAKKTDKPSPDDVDPTATASAATAVNDVNDENGDGDGDADGGDSKPSTSLKSKKSDLDVTNKAATNTENADDNTAEEENVENVAPETNEENEETMARQSTTDQGARKRKPRKE